MFRLGIILMVVCFTASLVLAVTYKLTSTKIEEQMTVQEKEALEEVLTDADEFTQKKIDGLDYYEGLKDKNLIGYVLKVRGKGYGGNIDMLVGIGSQGEIKGVEVLSQEETPGLGSRITEIKQGAKKPWFLEQFKGKAAGDLKMSGIQAVSGATISSKAVLEAIKENVKEFMDRI